MHLIDQQEVAADMTLPVVRPLTLQRVVQPLGAQGCVIADSKIMAALRRTMS